MSHRQRKQKPVSQPVLVLKGLGFMVIVTLVVLALIELGVVV